MLDVRNLYNFAFFFYMINTFFKLSSCVNNTHLNPLGTMCIYICMQYKQAPTALSYTAKQDCGVNPPAY